MLKAKAPRAFTYTPAKVGVLEAPPRELGATRSRGQLGELQEWGERAPQRDAQEADLQVSQARPNLLSSLPRHSAPRPAAPLFLPARGTPRKQQSSGLAGAELSGSGLLLLPILFQA